MPHPKRVNQCRKDKFFQLVDLGKSIPEIDETRMTKEEMYAKLDKGIADYKKVIVLLLSAYGHYDDR
jgi:DNA topoisomerase IB